MTSRLSVLAEHHDRKNPTLYCYLANSSFWGPGFWWSFVNFSLELLFRQNKIRRNLHAPSAKMRIAKMNVNWTLQNDRKKKTKKFVI